MLWTTPNYCAVRLSVRHTRPYMLVSKHMRTQKTTEPNANYCAVANMANIYGLVQNVYISPYWLVSKSDL